MTFPYDDNADHTPHVNSSLVQPMGTTCIKAIAVCLLSKRDSMVEPMNAISTQEPPQLMETLKTTIIKQKHFNTPEKPQRQSARL
jgi:hypothetical protein